MTARATTEGAFEQMRFCLGIDDDHTPFVLRFQRDPFLGTAIRRLRGLRPVRLGTVAQALLRALCGQLILASEARAMERRIIRATTEARREWRHAPPTVADLARLSPAAAPQARPARAPRRHPRPPLRAGSSSGSRTSRPPSSPIA